MMKIRAALLLTAVAGLQLTLAQDVTDCTDIAAGLNTMPIDPVTGKAPTMICMDGMVKSITLARLFSEIKHHNENLMLIVPTLINSYMHGTFISEVLATTIRY